MRRTAPQVNAHRDFRLGHHAHAILFFVLCSTTSVAGHLHLIEPQIDFIGIKIFHAGVADGRQNAAEVRVGSKERCFDQRRVSHGIADLQRFGFRASTLHLNRDELACAFTVTNHGLRQMLPHDRKRADQCFQTRIVLTFDRKFTLPRGNGDERVVCAGVAVNRDAVKTRGSYTLGDLGQYVRRHARIGGNKTQHCGHARLNHARPLADARHRDELTVNEHLRGKRLLHGVGGHDGLRCLDPIVRSKIVDRLGKSCQKPIHRQRLHDDTGGKHKCLFGLAIKKLSQSLTRCLGVGQPRFSSPCICNARVHHKTAHVFGHGLMSAAHLHGSRRKAILRKDACRVRTRGKSHHHHVAPIGFANRSHRRA